MHFDTLEGWLAWQEQLHPSEIELGLDRVREVWNRLSDTTFACPVITVAGTNGKGSSVALLTAIYLQSGYRVGSYTSPHLWRYNERIALNGVPVTDDVICAAFAAIEQVREDVSLTYFEFGTLAALWIFQQQPLDVILLEVGLGGRLDAVNIIDADIALITSIDLEHQAWLGDTREDIAREKAGIMRPGQRVVINDPNSPATLLEQAINLSTSCSRINQDYSWRRENGQWCWQSGSGMRAGLPLPSISGEYQLQNAAGVLMVVEMLSDRLPVSQNQLREGLLTARVAGRFQIEQEEYTVIYDVAHNPAAASRLAEALSAYRHQRRVHIVFSVLRDKQIDGIVAPFCGLATSWFIAPLGVPRAAEPDEIMRVITGCCPDALVDRAESIIQAIFRAKASAEKDDIILVFGSFYTVAQAYRMPL